MSIATCSNDWIRLTLLSFPCLSLCLLMIKYSSLFSSLSPSVTSSFSSLSSFVCQVSVWQINDDWWLNTFDSVSVWLPFPFSLFFSPHRPRCLFLIHVSWPSAFSSIFTSFSQQKLCHHFRHQQHFSVINLCLSLFCLVIFMCLKVPFVVLVLRFSEAKFSIFKYFIWYI